MFNKTITTIKITATESNLVPNYLGYWHLGSNTMEFTFEPTKAHPIPEDDPLLMVKLLKMAKMKAPYRCKVELVSLTTKIWEEPAEVSEKVLQLLREDLLRNMGIQEIKALGIESLAVYHKLKDDK